MAVPPTNVRVLSQRPLAPSVTSVANDKDDNEIIPGAVHRSLAFALQLSKTQLEDRLMKGLCDQSSPLMGSFPPNEVAWIAQHVNKGERRKG